MNFEKYKNMMAMNFISEEKANIIINNLINESDKPKSRLSNRIIYITACSVVTCAVIVVSLLSINRGNLIVPVSKDESNNIKIYSENDTKKNGTDIIWNEVSIPNVSLMLYKDPLAESYTFTFEDFVNYIGCDPTPGYLPEGYNKDYSDTQNLFFDPDGKPTDYYSFYTLRYSSKSGSVAIRVGKSLINSHSDVPIERDKIKSSEINGIKMDLFKNMNTSETEENGMPVYMASFSQNGINYYVYSQGTMLADDFLKVISSID